MKPFVPLSGQSLGRPGMKIVAMINDGPWHCRRAKHLQTPQEKGLYNFPTASPNVESCGKCRAFVGVCKVKSWFTPAGHCPCLSCILSMAVASGLALVAACKLTGQE